MGMYDGLKKRMAERGTGGDLFLKLSDDGDNVIGVFRGEPLLREVFWNGERYEQKTDETPDTQRTSVRIAQNIVVLEGETWVPKILEQSNRFFQNVIAVDEKYGIDKWSFEITRKGASGDTNTTYSILPETKLNSQDRLAIDSQDLLDLKHILLGGGESDVPDIPKEKKATSHDHVIGILKEQSKEVVSDFLKTFKVKKVSELTDNQMPDVLEFLEKLDNDPLS